MNIVFKEDIDNWIQEFNVYEKAIIFGKGPTFKALSKDDENNTNTCFVCINDTINFVKKCDLLACNDIDSFDKIDLKNLKYCSNILIPYHPHKNLKFNSNINYNHVIDKIKDYFTGNLIIYNLMSSRKNYPNAINIKLCLSTSQTAFDFIGRYLKKLKKVDFYGVAMEPKNKDQNFHNIFLVDKRNTYNHNSLLLKYQNQIKEISNTHNIEYELH